MMLSVVFTTFLSSQSQETYRPLLKDGKVWNIEYTVGGLKTVQMTYFIEGDTVVDGAKCFKMYTTMTDTQSGETRQGTQPIVMLEADRQVWEVLEKGDIRRRILFDFNLSEGSSVSYGDSPELELCRIDSVEAGGRLFRRLTFRGNVDGMEATQHWIEGVGSEKGPLTPVVIGSVGNNMRLVSCYEDGECIFTTDDFEAPPVVSRMERTRHDADDRAVNLYDLQGRRLSGQLTKKGVYIKDGNKMISR